MKLNLAQDFLDEQQSISDRKGGIVTGYTAAFGGTCFKPGDSTALSKGTVVLQKRDVENRASHKKLGECIDELSKGLTTLGNLPCVKGLKSGDKANPEAQKAIREQIVKIRDLINSVKSVKFEDKIGVNKLDKKDENFGNVSKAYFLTTAERFIKDLNGF